MILFLKVLSSTSQIFVKDFQSKNIEYHIGLTIAKLMKVLRQILITKYYLRFAIQNYDLNCAVLPIV
jgi:hypothetical protein